MKKIIYYIVSLIINVIIAVVLYELFLQIVPVIYRNLPSSNDKIYVYVLGESSAWGQPYQGKISYAKIIQYMLDNKLDGKKIELKILASPGSLLLEQYKKYFFYKYLHPFEKGIVLIYMGTNNWANKDSDDNYDNALKFGVIDFLNTYFQNINNFKYEYERILSLSEKFGDDVYISSIAGNYAGFMPNNVASLVYNQPLKDKIEQIDVLISQGQYDIAIKQCNELLESNDDKSQIWYRIGKIYEGQKNVKAANEAYLNAIEFGWDARPTRYQNNTIRNLAKKYNIPVTDTFKKLEDSENVVGYNFFADKIHPSVKLHTIIAEGFVDLLAEKYQVKIVNNNLSQNNILKVCNFTEEDLFFQYAEIIREIFMYSYIEDIVCKYNFELLEQYILNMKRLNLDNYEKKQYVNLCEMFLKYLKGNKVEVSQILSISDTLKNKFSEQKLHCDIFCNWIIKKVK